MIPFCRVTQKWIGLALLVWILGLHAGPTQAAAPNATGERTVTIDFNDVDITVFIKFISELTQKNFVVDQRVKGRVTVFSPGRISVDEAYQVFESVLETHGYTTVESGQVIKIVPLPDARTKNIETLVRNERLQATDRVVTQVIPLKHADADEIKRLFAPLISPNSAIISYPPTNMVIVTDVYSNIQRLMKIMRALDVAGIGQEIHTLPLVHADVNRMVRTLNSIFRKTAGKGQKESAAARVRLVADERTNTLIVAASELEAARVRSLVELLDRDIQRTEGDVHVYYLQNALAEEMAKVLMAIPQQPGKPGDKGALPVLSNEIQIVADKATNALVVTAGKEEFQVIEDVIRKLDIPRRMVYIEALIIEIRASREKELGIEWYGLNARGSENDEIGASGGFRSGDTTIIPRVDGDGNAILAPGLTIGALGQAVTIGNLVFDNIGAAVRALQGDTDVNIISTPQIMTLDNAQAEITVGENVPYLTKSATGDQNYEIFEYRDVGVTLKITPQINQERFVRLNIYQEVIKLTQAAELTNFRPTTLKRAAETTVVVKDAHTVVIGGLTGDDMNQRETTVPCLGDIPLVGHLFRSQSSAGIKTNLYIFLTPHIIDSPDRAQEIYQEKSAYMDRAGEGVIKRQRPAVEKGKLPTDPISHPDR